VTDPVARRLDAWADRAGLFPSAPGFEGWAAPEASVRSLRVVALGEVVELADEQLLDGGRLLLGDELFERLVEALDAPMTLPQVWG
jgi:hypothetical protein